MSGSQAKVKKQLISSRPSRAQGRDGKLTLTKTRDKESSGSPGQKHDGNTHASPGPRMPGVLGVRSTKINPKERPSGHSVNIKSVSNLKDSEKKRMKSKTFYPFPLVVNHARLQVHNDERHGDRARPVSLGSSREKVTEGSTSEAGRTIANQSALKSKGPATERAARTPRKVSLNGSPSTRLASTEESRDVSIDDRVRELELPKVTMNEVLHSWNIGTPSRTRASSFAGKDPLEFLLTSERSDSDPKNKTMAMEELRTCRYLRTDARYGYETHSTACSCNSCEHGQGLKRTPFLNS